MKIGKITPDMLEEVVRLRRKHKDVTEKLLVSASRNPDSPLHKLFMWDDPDSAAALGRLEIARRLIVRVTITEEERTFLEWKGIKVKPQTRGLVGSRRGSGYRGLVDVMTNTERRQMFLRQALSDLEACQKKYHMLTELADVFKEIEAVSQAVKAG